MNIKIKPGFITIQPSNDTVYLTDGAKDQGWELYHE